MLFLNVPGRTVKAFLQPYFIQLQSEGKIALTTVSSGIVTTLLTEGCALHSTFKISLDLHPVDIPICT